MKQLLVLAAVLLAFLSGCGGSSPPLEKNGLLPGQPIVALPQNSGMISGQALHNVSGVPIGIRLSWVSVDDTADGGSRIAGYHIYRSINPIEDSSLGKSSFWVTIGGNKLISQPAPLGSEIVVEDLFNVNIGETWYYRLSSVAEDGDESALSPEATVVIAPFLIDELLTTTAGVGGPVEIMGQNFGVLDPTNDKVEIPGVVWTDGVGFNPILLDAAITDWTPGLITVEVPLGATFGKIKVTIGGVTVDTPEDFQNSDPYITAVDRLAASIIDPVTLTGKNFGVVADALHRVVYAGTELLVVPDYDLFSDTAITFYPQNLQDYSQFPLTVRVDTVDSNVAFNNLENAPPTGVIFSTPVTGHVPLDVTFNASGSFDPENDGNPNNGITYYHWDLDNDGFFNEIGVEAGFAGKSRADFTITTEGVYNAAVRVFDLEWATNDAPIAVDVAPPVPTIADDPLQPDPHQPGQVDNSSAPDYLVNLYYVLQDGLPPLKVEVDADYNETVPSDPVASFGQNDPAQVYETNSSPFAASNQNVADTVLVSQPVQGNYSFALRVTDDLGAEAVFVYPTPVLLSPPPPTIFDDPSQPNPDEPGQVDNSNAPVYAVNLFFGLQDGVAPLTVEVDADYSEVVTGDPLASFGQNNAAQVYETNNSPFVAPDPNIADAVNVTQTIRGTYFLALRVTDSIGRQAVYVYPTAVLYEPPPPIIFDDPTQPDPGDPGQVDNSFGVDYLVSLHYSIQNGVLPLTVEVDADYVETVTGDPLASFGQNDPGQVWETVRSPFAAAQPNPITDTVWVTQPVEGDYFFAMRVTDNIGRQDVFVYPDAVTLAQPYQILVVQDDEGDPIGAGATVSDDIKAMLDGIGGYQTTVLNRAAVDPAVMAGFDACIWASNRARGATGNPFMWLSLQDLTLIRGYEDIGGSAIIISPPFDNSGADIFQDGAFNNNYQPFQEMRLADGFGGVDIFPLDFTATGPPDIISIQYDGFFGDTGNTPIYGDSFLQMEWTDAGGGNAPVGAIRPGPNGGKLYMALLDFRSIVGCSPSMGVDVLLDYIVSGTIEATYP